MLEVLASGVTGPSPLPGLEPTSLMDGGLGLGLEVSRTVTTDADTAPSSVPVRFWLCMV